MRHLLLALVVCGMCLGCADIRREQEHNKAVNDAGADLTERARKQAKKHHRKDDFIETVVPVF